MLFPILRKENWFRFREFVARTAKAVELFWTPYVPTNKYTYSGGPTLLQDEDDVWQATPADILPGGGDWDGTKWVPNAAYTRQLVPTRQGNVAYYTDAPGAVNLPARTNYFLNSGAPVTQDISLTASTFTLTVWGTGTVTSSAGTAPGSGFGEASDGTPNTFTLTGAGTVTFTVAGDPPTYVNVEEGAYGTLPMVTGGETYTRPADELSVETPTQMLTGQDFAVYQALTPYATGQTGWAFSSYTDADNYAGLYIEADAATFRKHTSGSDIDVAAACTHADDEKIEFLVYQHNTKMGIAYRADDGLWSAWTELSDADGKAAAVISSLLNIGSLNDLTQFPATLPGIGLIDISGSGTPAQQIHSAMKFLRLLDQSLLSGVYYPLMSGTTMTGGPTVCEDADGNLQEIPADTEVLPGVTWNGSAYITDDLTTSREELMSGSFVEVLDTPSQVWPVATNLLFPSEYNATSADLQGNCLDSTLQFRQENGVFIDSPAVYIADNSVSYAYQRETLTAVPYTISAYVQLDNSSKPTVGADSASGDFSLIANATVVSGNLAVRQVGQTSIYRVSGKFTGITSLTSFGIVKYATQSNIGVKFSGLQVEEGSFATPYKPTTTATNTIPATVITRPTPQAMLDGNDFWVKMRVEPLASGQVATLFSAYEDADNYVKINATATEIILTKRTSGSSHTATCTYTHAADTEIYVVAYQSEIHGMAISVFESSAWETYGTLSDAGGKADAIPGSAYEVGCVNELDQFAANYYPVRIGKIQPGISEADLKAYLEAL